MNILDYLKDFTKLLQKYEEADIQLQRITNLSLTQMIDIAKACNLYADINGTKVPLHILGSAMKTWNCDFDTLYRNVLCEPIDAKKTSKAINNVLTKITNQDVPISINNIILNDKYKECKSIQEILDKVSKEFSKLTFDHEIEN